MNRSIVLASLLLVSSVPACVEESYPDDGVADTEVSDGKADGWQVYSPQGTYLAAAPGAGELTAITIKTDRTFERSTLVQCIAAPCNPIVESGTFKITHGGGTDYLRFLKADGSLLDRYAWEIHGRQLKLREVGATDWQELMIDDHKGSITSNYAGAYTQYGTGTTPDGMVFTLLLETTGQFRMTVRGVIGCDLPGHLCPSSWNDGYSGWTHFTGSWKPRTGGVTLTPTDDNTGETSPPIDLGMRRTQNSTAITGSLGSLQLTGPLTVRALRNATHSIKDANLDGVWTFTADNRSGGFASGIQGFAEAANGGTHRVTFDSKISEAFEESPNTNHNGASYLFQVAGDPTGNSLGVIYFRRGSEFAVLPIKSKTATTMVLRSNDDSFDFELTKQ
jgi:hypothetical protein